MSGFSEVCIIAFTQLQFMGTGFLLFWLNSAQSSFMAMIGSFACVLLSLMFLQLGNKQS